MKIGGSKRRRVDTITVFPILPRTFFNYIKNPRWLADVSKTVLQSHQLACVYPATQDKTKNRAIDFLHRHH